MINKRKQIFLLPFLIEGVIIVYLSMVVPARERQITPLLGRGCPQFANWGREWNSGEDLLCGTGKDILKRFVLLSLILRTTSNIPARIPLPTQLRRATFSPGEG